MRNPFIVLEDAVIIIAAITGGKRWGGAFLRGGKIFRLWDLTKRVRRSTRASEIVGDQFWTANGVECDCKWAMLTVKYFRSKVYNFVVCAELTLKLDSKL